MVAWCSMAEVLTFGLGPLWLPSGQYQGYTTKKTLTYKNYTYRMTHKLFT